MKSFFENFTLETFKALAPYLLLTVLTSAALVLGVLKVSNSIGIGSSANVTVAVFDVVKFANAQRALASTFIGKREDMGEAGTLLLSLSKKTTAAIEKVAGPNTLVLVKQGVVSGSQMDITDAVLTELGLPTNVPSVEPMKLLEDVAPTMLMMPNRDHAIRATAPAEKIDSASKVLP
jgi:hypothetical protein